MAWCCYRLTHGLCFCIFSISTTSYLYSFCLFFFFQAEDGIRDLVRSRGLGDVYKRQIRDYVLISLLTGARRANVLAMRWQDINFERAEWRIEETKNGTPQTLSLIHI